MGRRALGLSGAGEMRVEEASKLSRPRAGRWPVALAAIAVPMALAAIAVAWHMGARRGVVLEKLPPGARLLADALQDVATGKAAPLTRAHEISGKGGDAGARGDGVPDSASVHAMKFTGLERLALQMRKLTPLASMPRRDVVISASSLPAAGSHAWKVAETKAALRVSSLQLQLDKQQRRLDVENAEHAALLHGPVGEQLQARQNMAGRAKREVAAAKDMEAKARKLSDEVVSDLHVAKGHYDIKQWYRSQSAFKSSKESTDAVNKAKKLWAKAMVDREALRKMDGDSRYKAEGDKMEREQVRIDITERDMASTRGKLRRAKALRNALRQEAPGASVDGKHVESKDERGDKDAKHVPSKDQRGAVDAKRTGKHVERREPMTHGAGSAATGAPKARQIRARTRAVATRAVAHEEGAEVAQARSAEVAQVAQAQHSSESTAKMPPDMTRQMAADSTERTAHAKQEEREEKEERRTQRGLAKAKAKVLQLKEAERAFATGVDAIGVPAVAEAEDRHESLDEGGSPAREMELASSATAVETAPIVDMPFRPSVDERVAALVYSASPLDAQAHAAQGNAAHAAQGNWAHARLRHKLPLLERSLFLNW